MLDSFEKDSPNSLVPLNGRKNISVFFTFFSFGENSKPKASDVIFSIFA